MLTRHWIQIWINGKEYLRVHTFNHIRCFWEWHLFPAALVTGIPTIAAGAVLACVAHGDLIIGHGGGGSITTPPIASGPPSGEFPPMRFPQPWGNSGEGNGGFVIPAGGFSPAFTPSYTPPYSPPESPPIPPIFTPPKFPPCPPTPIPPIVVPPSTPPLSPPVPPTTPVDEPTSLIIVISLMALSLARKLHHRRLAQS